MKQDITPRQLEILQLLADGLNSEEIGIRIGNSKKTIDNMRISLMLRVQAKNVAHLIAIGFRNNWIK